MKNFIAAALCVSLAGCSHLVGPAPTDALYRPEISSLEKMGSLDWTNFSSLPEAKKRLAGMVYNLNNEARQKEKIRLGSGDVATLGAVASVIGGIEGKLDVAKWGAGIAGALGIADQRYQLVIQRTNMINAARAFQCVRDSVDGLNEIDLKLGFLPTEDANDDQIKEIERLNETRYDVLRLLSNAAYEIRNALEDAQARVEVKQPDVEQIRQALQQQFEQENRPAPVTGTKSDLQDLLPGSKNLDELFGVPTQLDITNMFEIASRLKQMHAEDSLVEARLNDWIKAAQNDLANNPNASKADKARLTDKIAAYTVQLKDVQAHLGKIATAIGEVSQAMKQSVTSAFTGDSRQRFVQMRIKALPERLRVCRGLMPAT